MHMRVAGRLMDVELLGGRHPMAPLFHPGGGEFSAPILPDEAGIYGDVERGFYCYPARHPEQPSDARDELFGGQDDLLG
jgi:hypothetical protein